MIEIEERRPWSGAAALLIIGPGGAGKSSLGRLLAPRLGRDLLDLDEAFGRRWHDIGAFIGRFGYHRYKTVNAALASRLVRSGTSPVLLVTSSGFLTDDNPPHALRANERLLKACHSICLLPSRDLREAAEVIVRRQLTRPFARDEAREMATIQHRYPQYRRLGDLTVFSTAAPPDIAEALADHLERSVDGSSRGTGWHLQA